MLIDLELAKRHLRIDGEDEDDMVALYVDAAVDQAMQFLSRNVYPDAAAVADAIAAGDSTAMQANASFTAAVLLITGHLYANREDVVTGTIVSELKGGACVLLQPYRTGMGA